MLCLIDGNPFYLINRAIKHAQIQFHTHTHTHPSTHGSDTKQPFAGVPTGKLRLVSDAVEDEGQTCNIQEGCVCFFVSGSLEPKKKNKKKTFNNDSYVKEMIGKKRRYCALR